MKKTNRELLEELRIASVKNMHRNQEARIKRRKETQYIRTLPKETQELVEKELRAQGLSEEDVQVGMDSRLCDLSDTIDIKKII